MQTVSNLPAMDIPNLYADSIREMDVYIMFRIAKRVAELTPGLTEKGRAPIKLSIGAPVTDPPKALIEYLQKMIGEPGMHGYSTPRGEAFFCDGVQRRMKNRFGVDIDPKTEVCSLIGSKEGLANMFRALITPKTENKDVIMIPDPGYASYVDSIKICGGEPYPMQLTPENQYKPNLEETLTTMREKGITPERVKAVILNYPSNPIGALAGLDYFEQAVAFCRKYNILLISDVAYADLYFEGEEPPHSVLEIPGAKDVTIEFHSLSKPYSTTGWRMGFAVGHKDAIHALECVKGTVDSGMFKCMQKAAIFAMEDPEVWHYVLKMNKQYQENQKTMVEGLASLGWPVADMNPPKATFYLWMPTPPRFGSCEAFCDQLLEKSGIVTVPGTGFGQYGEGYFRMSLVDSPDKLVEAIKRMREDGFTFNEDAKA